ncbi:MAG: carbon monoxide dehydrogenase subunit G [Alphaproteobacteria bacterium]|nr:carbon monoxide dehydrogenase subunit G [Alphaproteobacteria bacterium]
MNLSGSETIPAPREAVWKGLNDPKILQKCIPGCESITQNSPTEMSAKVGPVKASFSGNVKLSDLNPPESYKISGQGQGGLAGFASGSADVKLTALGPNETRLDYAVDAQIGGKLAMLGSRLIGSTAQSLAGQFFSKFASLIKHEAQAAPAEKAPAKKPAKKVAPKKPAAKKPAAKKAAPKKAAKKKKK